MRRKRVQVSPAGGVPRRVLRDLAREFPEVLLVLHPLFETWQAYEAHRESSWDADKLRQAIVSQYSQDEGDPQLKWWAERGAPQIFEGTMPMPPGEWTVEWLRQRELHRTGGAKQFLREVEERAQRVKQAAAKDRHAENLGKAEEYRKMFRDEMSTGESRTDAMKQIRAREGRAEIVA